MYIREDHYPCLPGLRLSLAVEEGMGGVNDVATQEGQQQATSWLEREPGQDRIVRFGQKNADKVVLTHCGRQPFSPKPS